PLEIIPLTTKRRISTGHTIGGLRSLREDLLQRLTGTARSLPLPRLRHLVLKFPKRHINLLMSRHGLLRRTLRSPHTHHTRQPPNKTRIHPLINLNTRKTTHHCASFKLSTTPPENSRANSHGESYDGCSGSSTT